MKFRTAEWTLNLNYAIGILERSGRPKNAQHLQELLAWLLHKLPELERMPAAPDAADPQETTLELCARLAGKARGVTQEPPPADGKSNMS